MNHKVAQTTKVVVNGALGRMGREVIKALSSHPQMEPVGAADKGAGEDRLTLPDQSGYIPLSADLEALLKLTQPDVMVDFSIAEATLPAVRTAVKHKVGLVIGTTGFTQEDLDEIDALVRDNDLGAVVAPNFSLGAVIMVHMAKIGARFFDYAEIIELHHEQKLDAPSGTASSTAQAMLEARGNPFSYSKAQKETISNTRGGEKDGIAIHSVRLPGLMAHQEVLFGAAGQTLRIRHDTINRECYMPGVILAVQKVTETRGLVYGLDKLLGL